MGNTTIIEINHDRCGEIEDNPEEFVQAIKEQMGCFKYSNMTEKRGEWHDGRIPGGYVIAGFHRSDNTTDRLWEKFKSALRTYYQKRYE